jgi:hypothetical protein
MIERKGNIIVRVQYVLVLVYPDRSLRTIVSFSQYIQIDLIEPKQIVELELA